jgi:hypothetical protein
MKTAWSIEEQEARKAEENSTAEGKALGLRGNCRNARRHWRHCKLLESSLSKLAGIPLRETSKSQRLEVGARLLAPSYSSQAA